jgi:hypothetical protein
VPTRPWPVSNPEPPRSESTVRDLSPSPGAVGGCMAPPDNMDSNCLSRYPSLAQPGPSSGHQASPPSCHCDSAGRRATACSGPQSWPCAAGCDSCGPARASFRGSSCLFQGRLVPLSGVARGSGLLSGLARASFRAGSGLLSGSHISRTKMAAACATRDGRPFLQEGPRKRRLPCACGRTGAS